VSTTMLIGIAALIVLALMVAAGLLVIWSLCRNDPMGEVDMSSTHYLTQADIDKRRAALTTQMHKGEIL